jgi:hypothetical protein
VADKEWLEQLKSGDEVYVSVRIGTPQKGEVTRLTKAQIFVTTRKLFCGNANESAFHKKSGYSVGGGIWHSTTLLRPTDELRERWEVDVLKRKATKLRDSLSIPQTKAELLEFIGLLSKFSKAGAE